MNNKKFNFYVKKMQKLFIMLFGICEVVFCLSGCTSKKEAELALYQLNGHRQEENDESSQAADMEETKVLEHGDEEFLCVHICGAVKNPGVYELPKGSRVYTLIELAGGLTDDADPNYVNQAQPLEDAAQIEIPTYEEAESMRRVESGLVNINTANESELCTLPGVGEAKARAIIEYRTQTGGFHAVEDIMNISGIKEGLYEKIADQICVE